MNLNLLNLDGIFPQHIELSPNPCIQGCEYCYAKLWKKQFHTTDKIINFILKESDKKYGLLPFYLRKKEPIAFSNSTDIICHSDWYNLLKTVKKLGYPLYIQTKGSKDFIKSLDFLDENDTVYFTITGNNLYEENNLLNSKEKIKLASLFSEKGIYTNVAFNPWFIEKITVKKAIEIINQTKPKGVIARPYHGPKFNRVGNITNCKSLYKMKEDKTGQTEKDLVNLAYECQKIGIAADIDFMQKDLKFYKDENLVYKHIDNNRRFGGNTFIIESELIYMATQLEKYRKRGDDAVYLDFDSFIESRGKTLKYHEGCLITKQDIKRKIWTFEDEKDLFSYSEYMEIMWKNDRYFGSSHIILDDDKDDKGRHILYYDLRRSYENNS